MKRMIDKFLWWMTERHDIHLRRTEGKPPPWTKDKILRTYKFTNVYRELDRVTMELHKHIDILTPGPLKLYHIMAFRAFNWPPTYEALTEEPLAIHDFKKMTRRLHKRANAGKKIFTGAYIVTNGGDSRSKIDVMCDALRVMYAGRDRLWQEIRDKPTMQNATECIAQFPMQGMFTAYEVACDLRYQKGMLLENAVDRMTWANPGPGANRGLRRITHVKGSAEGRRLQQSTCIEIMRELLLIANKELPKRMPRLEMREIEHSLCEFDKYMRAARGEGRPRSKFIPTEEL